MEKNILIIDDHHGFRKGLKFFFEKQKLEIICYEASSGEEGIDLAIKEKPIVIIMDFQLPCMDGIQASEKIKQSLPKTKIIMVSLFETRESIKRFKKSKIDAFVAKSNFENELMPILMKYLK